MDFTYIIQIEPTKRCSGGYSGRKQPASAPLTFDVGQEEKMLRSVKAIFFGLGIIIGTLFVVGTLMGYTIYPVMDRVASSFLYKLVLLISPMAAGLSSGYFVALIAGRKEVVHTLIVVGLYTLLFHVPSLISKRGNFSSDLFHIFLHLFAITVPALITAYRISQKRAQQIGAAEAPAGKNGPLPPR